MARQEPPSIPEVAAAFPGFEVIGLAGVGGMGFVYRVRSHDDGRESCPFGKRAGRGGGGW